MDRPTGWFGRRRRMTQEEVHAARRISVAMITQARTGAHMSIAEFIQFADDAGLADDREKLLRLAIRVAWFNADVARELLGILEGQGFPAEEFLRRMGQRVATLAEGQGGE
jgi:hypothetical protein